MLCSFKIEKKLFVKEKTEKKKAGEWKAKLGRTPYRTRNKGGV
jgi:hypothetical protein